MSSVSKSGTLKKGSNEIKFPSGPGSDKFFLSDNVIGDFLCLSEHQQIEHLLTKAKQGESVLFSDFVLKINRKGEEQKRIFLLTQHALYNLKPGSLSCKRRIGFDRIGGITVSSSSEELAVHVIGEYDYRYAISRNLAVASKIKELAESSPIRTSIIGKIPVKLTTVTDESLEPYIVTKDNVKGDNPHPSNVANLLMETPTSSPKTSLTINAENASNGTSGSSSIPSLSSNLISAIVEEEEGAEETSRPLVETLASLTISEQITPVVGFETADKLTLADFDAISELGRGNYGRVVLVKRKTDGQVFAMKMLSKEMVIAKNQVTHTLTERDVMVTVSRSHPHPFLVQLHYAFQTKKTLYFIMDFVSGGELFFHLDKLDRFSEEMAKFFVAEIALALGHLHALNVIYRDLKPENVLLGADGHVKLADFGLSKISPSGEGARTLCGTAEYFSPEALLGQQYNSAVDWWALGVLLYELTLGVPPFRDPQRNVHVIYDKILKVAYEPLTFLSVSAQKFIKECLEPDPTKRLGSKGGVEEIKNHEFFQGIDWTALAAKKVPPPYLPPLNSHDDVQNFVPTDNGNQPLVSQSFTPQGSVSHQQGGGPGSVPGTPKSHRRTHTNISENPFRHFSFDGGKAPGPTPPPPPGTII